MSRPTIVGATVATAALLAPAAASADSLRDQYLKAYKRAERAGGEPGRNIVRDGVALRGDRTRPARRAEIRRSLTVLVRMAAPAVTTNAAAPAAPAVAAAGGGALPSCTWVPESGGDYTARNPSSGAGGKYQIIPSTWKAYGGSTANAADASSAEQEAVAARIYAGQGPSAWVNC